MSESGGFVEGLSGAAVASLCIFLPSFLFVAILGPIVPRLRKNYFTATFLDSVNAVSMGLLGAVALKFAYRTLVHETSLDVIAAIIFSVAMFIQLRWKLNPAWLVLGGAIIGGILSLV